MNDALMALVFKYGAARCDVDRSNTAKNQRVCNEAIEAIRAALRDQPPSVPQGVHPNHLPDLRYVLRVLQGAHVPGHQRSDVQAAINGMRYIIKRTEDATPSAPSSSQQGEADHA